ncbi:MAG: hypothetical protein D6731_13425 [Planctomycetota bacterium]|nr:MAG: hypothetical protein D6731_13425 [Planctomycetota bacterium]
MPERTIRVDKARLIERLNENRARHEREYQEALEGYKARLVLILSRKLEAAKRRLEVDHLIDLEVPREHFEDYDRALALLDWEQGDSVELTHGEFERYVLDAWPWKGKFRSVHASYIRPANPNQ